MPDVSEPQEPEEAANDARAMLDIIKEKDKIIVSLKESSTQRDKINEKQIKLLSEDNEKKLSRITALTAKMRQLEKSVAERDSRLALVDERRSSQGIQLEDLKSAVDDYKDNISRSLGEIRDMVTRELCERDERGEHILERMRENQGKLEGKLTEVEQYYKNIIQGLAEKQVKSRLFIRKSLVELQEALSQLDLNPSQPILDSRVASEFADILSQSSDLADEYRARGHDASTVIHNIENVHIQLASTPKLDRFFDESLEQARNQETTQEKHEELSQLLEDAWNNAGSDALSSADAGAGAAGETPEQPSSQTPESPEQPGQTPESPEQPSGQTPESPEQPSGQTPESAKQPGKAPEGPQPKPGPRKSDQPQSPYTPPRQYPPQAPAPPGPQAYNPSSAAPAMAPMVMTVNAVQPESQAFKTEEDLILRESPNLAPYNWDMLPISSPLLHFRRMLNSAKKAEAQRNFIKAIGIYQAVMEQKTIQENVLARNILKDQLEALDRLARSQISLNPKRKDIERYFTHDENEGSEDKKNTDKKDENE